MPSSASSSSSRRRRTRTRSTIATIPRPPNSFILFRQEYGRLHTGPNNLQSNVSKDAGEAWRALSDEEKQYYKDLAAVEKQKHMEKYPEYRFRPQRKEVKDDSARTMWAPIVTVDSQRAWTGNMYPPAPHETAPLPQPGPSSCQIDPGHDASYFHTAYWPSSLHATQDTQEQGSHLQQYYSHSNNVDNHFDDVQFFGVLLPPLDFANVDMGLWDINAPSI